MLIKKQGGRNYINSSQDFCLCCSLTLERSSTRLLVTSSLAHFSLCSKIILLREAFPDDLGPLGRFILHLQIHHCLPHSVVICYCLFLPLTTTPHPALALNCKLSISTDLPVLFSAVPRTVPGNITEAP